MHDFVQNPHGQMYTSSRASTIGWTIFTVKTMSQNTIRYSISFNAVNFRCTYLSNIADNNVMACTARKHEYFLAHKLVCKTYPPVTVYQHTFFSKMATHSVLANHLWLLMSSSPSFRLPKRFVKSTCRMFLMRSFRSLLKCAGTRY